MRKLNLFLLALALFVPAAGWGQGKVTVKALDNGSDFLEQCADFNSAQAQVSSYTDGIRFGACAAYLQATRKVLTSARRQIIAVLSPQAAEELSFPCVDSSVTVSQLYLVVTKWLNAHPENLHYSLDSLIQGALVEAFPCHKETQ